VHLSKEAFDKAREFIRAHARPLDRALFEFYFEGGSASAVLIELARFQNADGGFGRGIEPDFRSPTSSPMATSVGLQYAAAIHAGADEPLVEAAVHYLLNTYDLAAEYWPATFLAVNDAPHAPWWHIEKIVPPGEDAWPNPSAELMGYLYRYAALVPGEFLKRAARRIRRNLDHSPTLEGFFRYNLLCWQRALPDLPSDLREAARAAIQATFAKYPVNEENYGEVGIFWLAPAPDSILAQRDPGLVQVQLDAAILRQAADGGWWPGWQWGQYEDAWEIAKREWAGKMTVEALHVIREFDRFE
jgi:hypothetical protein